MLIFTKLLNFVYTNVENLIYMVDNIFRKVDFLLAVFFCLFACSGASHAQNGQEDYLVINSLSRENGLPDQDVNGIYFDSLGYAWICTFGGGLVRYDGDSFIKFSKKTDPAMNSDYVYQCCEDGFGRLWIPGTGGLDILDLKTLTFVSDLPGMPDSWQHSRSFGPVSRDAKGCMWFRAGNLLYRVAFADDGGSIVMDSIQCKVPNTNLTPDPFDVENDGSVWISLNGKIFKIRYVEEKGLCMSEVLPEINIGEDNKATAYLRSGNDIWIGTLNGLYRVNLTSGAQDCFRKSESEIHSLPNNEVTSLCLSLDGKVVCGTLGGVAIYNPSTGSFDNYGSRANAYGNKILPGEMVRRIAAKGQQIWVGLEAEGLAVMQRKSLQITNLSHIESTEGAIPSTPVRALFIDSRGVLWLATTEYGLCRQNGEMLFKNYNSINSSLSDNSITAFCEDGNGRLWFGTVNGHVNYINTSYPEVIHHPAGENSETAKKIDVINGMLYDNINDYIWIMARNGLYIYDLSSSMFTEYDKDCPSCLGTCISSGKLWMSSRNGMIVIDQGTLESKVITDIPFSMSLVPDGDTIWAGTFDSGLYKIENYGTGNPDITVYSESDGLADNQVMGLLLDGVYLWITTENGLSRLDTQIGEITSFNRKDGLKSMAFCENSISKGSDGTIYLGQKEGLSMLSSSYVPSGIMDKPDIVISGYYLNDEFYSLTHSDTIFKNEKDNDFTLKFSDLSYSTASDITYESRILPMDKNWSTIFENDTHVKFGRIPGGNYRIQIRAVDKNGNVLSQDEKLLDIRPVFYKRWWFFLLAFLLAAAMVYYGMRLHTKSISKKKDMLQQEVDRQTKILLDQKAELLKKTDELSEQNALLQRQNEMIARQNTIKSGTMSQREADFSTELMDAIQKMYKDPELDIYSLADAMGMSRSVLNERIQQTLGQSIAQFIRTYRLNVAKEMICNRTHNDMNISEIAYEVGFNDPKYFTRCFTKEFNITPSEMHKESS